jgi:hypothetical protein
LVSYPCSAIRAASPTNRALQFIAGHRSARHDGERIAHV